MANSAPCWKKKTFLIVRYDELTPKEKKLLREFYYTNIFPASDPAINRPGPPVSVHFESVSQSAGVATLPKGETGITGADQGAG